MERKEINIDQLVKSIRRRTGDITIKNVRIVRRFEESGRNYTEFLYDSPNYFAIGSQDPYDTHRCIYEDTWCC